MVLDTSAIFAVLLGEPQQELFLRAIVDAPSVSVSAATVVEAGIVAEARGGELLGRELDLFLHKAGARIVPLTAEQADDARRAWRRFGRGRHPAALNLGDCFAYALSIALSEPLLFTGRDFGRTDVEPAVA